MQISKRNVTQRAFTLIELLVVILILSILAALIIPKLIGRTTDAKIAAAKSDISTLSSGLEQYRIDNDKFPSTDDGGLNALITQPSDAPHWKGPYLEKNAVPNDPWGHPYIYECPGANGEDFLITSYGPDGQAGGGDDITSDDISN
jgi:general secretion pathway protein G